MCHSSSKVLFTFESKSNFSRSLIDHLFVSDPLFKYIYLYMSQHESDNFSDHCPVSINLNIQTKYTPLSKGDNKRK